MSRYEHEFVTMFAGLEKQLQPASHQSDLFAAVAGEPEPPGEDAVRAALAAIKPDELSPREALEALYRLKKVADE